MSLLSGVYGRAARFRRAWYGRDPYRTRQLAQPVISVGNLVVGGSGKTPVVATLARLLLAAGERPAILSRGYGRLRTADGVVVVSDAHEVLVRRRSQAMSRRCWPGRCRASRFSSLRTDISRDVSPNDGSAAPCTCWTMGSSICNWRETSTCW